MFYSELNLNRGTNSKFKIKGSKIDPSKQDGSGLTKTKPAMHTIVLRSNSRHVAYSKNQGRSCTALPTYSSLFYHLSSKQYLKRHNCLPSANKFELKL